jgi:hypothetical protein
MPCEPPDLSRLTDGGAAGDQTRRHLDDANEESSGVSVLGRSLHPA